MKLGKKKKIRSLSISLFSAAALVTSLLSAPAHSAALEGASYDQVDALLTPVCILGGAGGALVHVARRVSRHPLLISVAIGCVVVAAPSGIAQETRASKFAPLGTYPEEEEIAAESLVRAR